MSFLSNFDVIWQVSSNQILTVGSSGGVAASTTVFGTQCYAVYVNHPGSASSTGGIHMKIITTGDAAVTSTGTLLSPNVPSIWKVNPGQRMSFLSNDAATPIAYIAELTK